MTPDDDPPVPRGRPKALEPGTSLSAWIPVSEYDRLVKVAKEHDVSLSALVRQWLKEQR